MQIDACTAWGLLKVKISLCCMWFCFPKQSTHCQYKSRFCHHDCQESFYEFGWQLCMQLYAKTKDEIDAMQKCGCFL
jgi:hypothetical protein